MDSIQPAQLVRLKKIYASLKDGMSKPSEWFEETNTTSEDDPVNQVLAGKKPEKKKAEPNWQQLINDSQSHEELQAVVDSLPDSVKEELNDAIVLKQDLLRSGL
jgi:hypothetical protein